MRSVTWSQFALIGTIYALGAAVCFGTASVLQAVAARAAEPGTGSGVDAALFLRAVRQGRYLLGLGLGAAGFVLKIIALRHIPIYAVGAAPAASLVVTAVVAARLLRVRLSRTEWAAVWVVCAGLLMLGLSSGEEGRGTGSLALKLGLLAVAGLVLMVGAVAGRLPDGPALGAGGRGALCLFQPDPAHQPRRRLRRRVRGGARRSAPPGTSSPDGV